MTYQYLPINSCLTLFCLIEEGEEEDEGKAEGQENEGDNVEEKHIEGGRIKKSEIKNTGRARERESESESERVRESGRTDRLVCGVP